MPIFYKNQGYVEKLAAKTTQTSPRLSDQRHALFGGRGSKYDELNYLVTQNNRAGQFTRTATEYLSIDDNPALSTGDIDFSLTAWVYPDSEPSSMGIAGKFDAGKREYLIDYASDAFRFLIGDSGGSVVGQVSLGPVSVATWYFVAAYHDAANNKVAISVNGSAFTLTNTSGGAGDNTSQFVIGSDRSNTAYMDGRIQGVGFWKRVLTTADVAELYQGGKGRDVAEFSDTLKTNLIAYWRLEERSGSRLDAIGGNTLTDNNTVTSNPGVIVQLSNARDADAWLKFGTQNGAPGTRADQIFHDFTKNGQFP